MKLEIASRLDLGDPLWHETFCDRKTQKVSCHLLRSQKVSCHSRSPRFKVIRSKATPHIQSQLPHIILFLTVSHARIKHFHVCWSQVREARDTEFSGPLSEWDLDSVACTCALTELSTFDLWNKIQSISAWWLLIHKNPSSLHSRCKGTLPK